MAIQPFGLQDLIDLITAAYGAQALTPAATGQGSQAGPSFRAAAIAEILLQGQNLYIESIARLSTMQDPLSDGTPNPDVDSFINAFGFERNGPGASLIYVTVTLDAVQHVDTVVQNGYVFGATSGPNFLVAPNGTGYNSSSGGYVIPAGQLSVQALTVCAIDGAAGNVLAGQITEVIGGPNNAPPNPLFSVSNVAAYNGGSGSYANTPGVVSETGNPLKTRFAQYISGGGEGSVNSILAAVGAAITGLTYSYGDYYMSVFSGGSWVLTPNTPAWFTVVADIAGAPGTITSAQLTQIFNDLLLTVRSGGIYYNVIPPTTVSVAGAGTVVVIPGFDPTATEAAVNAAFISFVNNLGLDFYGNPIVCSINDVYVALRAVPGVLRIDGLLLNNNNADQTADFGQIFIAGTAGFHT